MKLTIEHFRCYRTSSFQFNNFTLVKGLSGSGKSTIFAAISWVLYGIPRNVLPHNIESLSKSERPHVRLEIDNLIIDRYKRPELLEVQILRSQSQGSNIS